MQEHEEKITTSINPRQKEKGKDKRRVTKLNQNKKKIMWMMSRKKEKTKGRDTK